MLRDLLRHPAKIDLKESKVTALTSATAFSGPVSRHRNTIKSFLPSQLKATAEIWQEISRSPTPADRWLGNYFHSQRKKFGSRDRRFISETVYALFRHKIFLNHWAAQLKVSEETAFLVLMAAATETLIEEDFFKQELANHF